MEPAVSPNQRKNPVKPFWKNPATDRPISLGLRTTVRLDTSEAQQETRDQDGEGDALPATADESFEQPGMGVRSSR